MAALEPVAQTFVQRDNLVLPSEDSISIDRCNLPGNWRLRGVRRIADEFARRHGCKAVADSRLEAQCGQRERRGNNFRFAVQCIAVPAGQGVKRRPDVSGLVAQQLLGARVQQGLGLAEHAVVALLVLQRTSNIRRIATPHLHAPLLRRDDARCRFEFIGAEDHGLIQKRLDQVERNRCDRTNVAPLGANFRRQFQRPRIATGGAACGPTRLPEAQPRTPVDLVEEQDLPRVDEVRIAHLVEVHAPQLGPAPRAFQVQRRNVPERVARLDGVGVGRIGCKVGKGDSALCHFLRRTALLLGDWIIDSHCACRGQRGGQKHRGRRDQRRTACSKGKSIAAHHVSIAGPPKGPRRGPCRAPGAASEVSVGAVSSRESLEMQVIGLPRQG